jgi:hypothetical protein
VFTSLHNDVDRPTAHICQRMPLSSPDHFEFRWPPSKSHMTVSVAGTTWGLNDDTQLSNVVLETPEDRFERAETSTTTSPRGKHMKYARSLSWFNLNSSEVQASGRMNHPKPKRNSGRRKGHLRPENAEKARKMRKIGACLQCRLMKITVGPMLIPCPDQFLTTLSVQKVKPAALVSAYPICHQRPKFASETI